jgi:hypothetical protein
MNEAYPDARADALDDTGLLPRTFPTTCAFSIEQILDPDYLPDDER